MNGSRETKEGQEDDEAEETVEEATTAATDMDSLAAEESSVIREDPCIEIFQQDLTVLWTQQFLMIQIVLDNRSLSPSNFTLIYHQLHNLNQSINLYSISHIFSNTCT